ncbi:DUF6328 family protein [Zhihengliuella halotolerans]|uniref:Sodium:proton antiporter n=1 Tax=Zhihengliuella halotolerans TaxID=370736 RepID=A0A4Q8AD96_9MICC|nr:DUF6328 family protein [Zhihengliuella halotolerans]RZU62200.1 hypothetical protein EV380_1790 [Zhihengliuella halotolerans]
MTGPKSRREFGASGSYERDESDAERFDRNWIELLQELRVMQMGTQIMTAFLMTLPFHSAFGDLSDFQVVVYVVLLVSAALVTGLLMVPVAIHRRFFQRRVKQRTVRYGHRVVRISTLAVGLVISLAVFFVVDVALHRTAALWIGGGVLLAGLFMLLVLPMMLRPRS